MKYRLAIHFYQSPWRYTMHITTLERCDLLHRFFKIWFVVKPQKEIIYPWAVFPLLLKVEKSWWSDFPDGLYVIDFRKSYKWRTLLHFFFLASLFNLGVETPFLICFSEQVISRAPVSRKYRKKMWWIALEKLQLLSFKMFP